MHVWKISLHTPFAIHILVRAFSMWTYFTHSWYASCDCCWDRVSCRKDFIQLTEKNIFKCTVCKDMFIWTLLYAHVVVKSLMSLRWQFIFNQFPFLAVCLQWTPDTYYYAQHQCLLMCTNITAWRRWKALFLNISDFRQEKQTIILMRVASIFLSLKCDYTGPSNVTVIFDHMTTDRLS